MREAFFVTILAISFIVGVIWLLVLAIDSSVAETTKECQTRYGQEWGGKYDHYGPNFCVNDSGEVKYLK